MNLLRTVKAFFVFCMFLGFGCSLYYFDNAPAENKSRLNDHLSNAGFKEGVYEMIQEEDTTEKRIRFVNHDFSHYKIPVLTTEKDTIDFLRNCLLQSTLVGIRNKEGRIVFDPLYVVPESVYNDYCMKKGNGIPVDDKTAFLFELKKDSILSYKCLVDRGMQICIDDSIKTYPVFREKGLVLFIADTPRVDYWSNFRYDYFTVADSSLYGVSKEEKEDSVKQDHYRISRILIDKDSIRVFDLFADTDSSEVKTQGELLAKMNIDYSKTLIHYREEQLKDLFASPLAHKSTLLTKIKNFPDMSSSKRKTNWWLIGGIAAVVLSLLFFVFRRKSK
jgi:hypothetical protein